MMRFFDKISATTGECMNLSKVHWKNRNCKPTLPPAFPAPIPSPGKWDGGGGGEAVAAGVGRASSCSKEPTMAEHTRYVGLDEQPKKSATLLNKG